MGTIIALRRKWKISGGKNYETRSNSNGSFDITDRSAGATRYSIDTSGNHSFTGASVKFGGFDVALKPKFGGKILANGTIAYNGGSKTFTVSHGQTGIYGIGFSNNASSASAIVSCSVSTESGATPPGIVVCTICGPNSLSFSTYDLAGNLSDRAFFFSVVF